jgi:hypothetical protein
MVCHARRFVGLQDRVACVWQCRLHGDYHAPGQAPFSRFSKTLALVRAGHLPLSESARAVARPVQLGVGVPDMRSYFRKYWRASATSCLSVG